jgi:hypothetical protein
VASIIDGDFQSNYLDDLPSKESQHQLSQKEKKSEE